jgi:hypothetical protein
MASGIRRTRKGTFWIDTSAYRCEINDMNIMRGESIPGTGYVGAFQPGQPRPGAQWIEANITIELRSRSAASGALSTDEAWGKLLVASGFARATGASNALPNTYTLGDIHASGDTPSGDTTALSTFGLQIDGTASGSDFLTISGNKGLCDVELVMVAGQIPALNFTIFGQITDGTAAATNLTLANAKAYATEGTAAPWYGSTTAVNSVATLVIKEYRMKANNVIPVRMDANATVGVAEFRIAERDPRGVLVYEVPDGSSITAGTNPDELWIDNTEIPLSFTYVAGGVTTAGAAISGSGGGKTFTITQKVYVCERPTLVGEGGGFLTWSVPICQSPIATAADAFRLSLAA